METITLTAIIGAVLALSIIVAVSLLTWHGDITGEAALALFSTMGGGGVVGGAVHLGAKQGARAARGGE